VRREFPFLNNFGSALQKSGLAPSPQDTRALFLEFDIDGNNEISYDEFILALRVLIPHTFPLQSLMPS
jgi:Ca2+-binding EF-hand superfamily protein